GERLYAVAASVLSDSPTRPQVLYVLLPNDRTGPDEDMGRIDERLAERKLSPREREVARELATGRTSPEIARRLSVTVHTVRRHTEKIFAKLGVRTRGELARRVAELARATPMAHRTRRPSGLRATASRAVPVHIAA
nr:helix-turn-helix transcriptional regulator [Gemmatimonadaceae bacterium]